jgi:hypothetical protein
MKEEDLIKKLENVELPDIELQGHKRRLRMALLDDGYSRREQKNAILELAKSKVKGVKDTMIRGLISQQPVWKTAVVGILAIALVLGLSLTIPSLTTDSVYAQAENIVRNSPEVHKALGEEKEIKVINVDIQDYEGTVIAQGKSGTISAKVDLNTNSVIDVAIFEIDEQAAIEIAEADPGVKELLDSGATIGKVSTLYLCGEMGNVETGETEQFTKTFVMVEIRRNGDLYIAHVDLSEGKVTSLTEEPLDPASLEPPTEEFFSITDPGAPDFASGEEGQ